MHRQLQVKQHENQQQQTTEQENGGGKLKLEIKLPIGVNINRETSDNSIMSGSSSGLSESVASTSPNSDSSGTSTVSTVSTVNTVNTMQLFPNPTSLMNGGNGFGNNNNNNSVNHKNDSKDSSSVNNNSNNSNNSKSGSIPKIDCRNIKNVNVNNCKNKYKIDIIGKTSKLQQATRKHNTKLDLDLNLTKHNESSTAKSDTITSNDITMKSDTRCATTTTTTTTRRTIATPVETDKENYDDTMSDHSGISNNSKKIDNNSSNNNNSNNNNSGSGSSSSSGYVDVKTCAWCDKPRARNDLCNRCRQKVESRARRLMEQKIAGDIAIIRELTQYLRKNIDLTNYTAQEYQNIFESIFPLLVCCLLFVVCYLSTLLFWFGWLLADVVLRLVTFLV